MVLLLLLILGQFLTNKASDLLFNFRPECSETDLAENLELFPLQPCALIVRQSQVETWINTI